MAPDSVEKTGLNQIKYGVPSTCLNYYNSDNDYNFSVWTFLNFDLIPSVKVLGNSDRLPTNIKYTIYTLRLYSKC